MSTASLIHVSDGYKSCRLFDLKLQDEMVIACYQDHNIAYCLGVSGFDGLSKDGCPLF